MSSRKTTGAAARTWRHNNGFSGEGFSHVQQTRLPEVEAGFTRSQILDTQRFGDPSSNPEFFTGGLHGFQSLGVGGSHPGLRTYHQMPRSSMLSDDKMYKLYPEDEETFTIGLAFRFSRSLSHEEKYNFELYPAVGHIIIFNGPQGSRFRFEVGNVIIPIQSNHATCLVKGTLVDITSQQTK